MTDLLVQVMKELLNEFAYYADCAGLHYDIQLAKGGIEILCYGYQDKLSILVLQALQELKNLVNPSEEKKSTLPMIFLRMKEKVLRTYYNSLFWQPYYHAILGTALCLEDPRFISADKHRALFSVEYEDFRSFVRSFAQSLKAEVFMHGNATVDEAKTLSTKIVDCLAHWPLPRCQDPIRRLVELSPGMVYLYRQHAKHFNSAEVNSALEVVYLTGSLTGAGLEASKPSTHAERIRVEALLNLLVQMVSSDAVILAYEDPQTMAFIDVGQSFRSASNQGAARLHRLYRHEEGKPDSSAVVSNQLIILTSRHVV
jgi:insulysin